MRIAIISARADPYIHPMDVHGGTTLVVNLVDALIEKGNDIHIFTRLDEYSPTNEIYKNNRALKQKEKGPGILNLKDRLTIYRLPYTSYPDFPEVWEHQIKESESFLRNVYPHLLNISPDIVHYFHMLSFVGWYRMFDKIPLINCSTFSPLLLSVNRKFEIISENRIAYERKILQDVPLISSQSEGEISEIFTAHSIPKNKVKHVPLGVNTNIYYKKEITDSPEDDRKYILISPNMIKPQKRQIEVIKITKGLQKLGHKIVTAFMGNIVDDIYMKQLTGEISACGLSYKIVNYLPNRHTIENSSADILFLPTQDESGLAKFIRSGDIAVFPSTDEGFSLLNLNCLASGTPVACYKKPEYSGYLNDENSHLVSEIGTGVESFIEKISYTLTKKELLSELSKKCSNSVQKFSWNYLVENQIQIYKKLIESSAK